ncbi:transposase [Inhella sp.]|uniref:transposase n=1 Tax=Inhella sp. TaxID=1921806 RepID=UPI0035B4994B
MARMPRLVLPGALHHVLQRGNNRQPVFVDDFDRQAYLDALREATRLHEVRVHGYVLMPDHVHLLVTPQAATSLARAMQTLGRRYVAAFNRRHGRTGTLWEGRFRTALVESPAYFTLALRYVEQHAMRSGVVERPQDIRWCSAAHHLGLHRDPLVSEHPAFWATGNTPFEREAVHRSALAQALSEQELALLRRHVHAGWPLLSDEGRRHLAERVHRPLAPRAAGRPVRRSESVPE